MFCDSNDTTLTSWRHACFENTHAKRSTYFGQTSWFPHEYRINVRIFKLSIKWRSGDVLRFQPHNPRLMWTRLLREHSCQTKHLFREKSWFPYVHRINVQIFQLSVKWTPGAVLRFQRHNPHLMWTRLLRENTLDKRSAYFGQKSWFP